MSDTVIDLLNAARERELLAISQYMMHHYELEDSGYGKLAERMKKIAFVEMRHAEDLAERILFLGGVPTTKMHSEPKKGLDIPEMLKADKGLEEEAIKMYNDSARACAEAGDQISKELFEELLANEEEHFDEFDVTLDHVDKLGNVYLATLLD